MSKELDDKMVKQSVELFEGKENEMMFSEGEIKELAELLDKVKGIISTQIADFEGKSQGDLDLMRSYILELDDKKKLIRYANILSSIQNFKRVWDAIKQKDSFENTLNIYRSRTSVIRRDEDELPF